MTKDRLTFGADFDIASYRLPRTITLHVPETQVDRSVTLSTCSTRRCTTSTTTYILYKCAQKHEKGRCLALRDNRTWEHYKRFPPPAAFSDRAPFSNVVSSLVRLDQLRYAMRCAINTLYTNAFPCLDSLRSADDSKAHVQRQC